MSLETVSLRDHNERIAEVIWWMLDRNAALSALGFALSGNTMGKLRALRAEIHRGTKYTENHLGKPCDCPRCRRNTKAASKQGRGKRNRKRAASA